MRKNILGHQGFWIPGVHPLTLITQPSWPRLACKRPISLEQESGSLQTKPGGHQHRLAPCSEWTLHTIPLHFAVMPNPPLPLGTVLNTEHGTLNLSASHPEIPTSALNTSHIYCAACGCSPSLTSHLHWAAGHHKLWCGTQLLMAGEVPELGGHGDGSWLGSTLGDLCSPATPWWELNTKRRAWAVLCVPPSSQRPGTLWSSSPWTSADLWGRGR